MLKKIIIGIAGAEEKSGCTHTALTMANYLKNRNLKVALAECNESGHYEEIREMVGQQLNNNCFNYNNIDIYPYTNNYILSGIFSKPYQFIILDFGSFKKCDKVMLSRADVKIITCGSRPWETMALNNVFEEIDEETLSYYNFYFNFTANTKQTMKDIIDGMGNLKNVFFPEYTENPFVAESFPGVDKIIGDVFEVNESRTVSRPREFNPFGRKKDIKENTESKIASVSQLERVESQFITEQFEKPDISVTQNIQKNNLTESISTDLKENPKELDIPSVPAETKENTTMNTLLDDSILPDTPKNSKPQKEKKNSFKIPLLNNSGKKKEKIIEYEEDKEVVKNLDYTLLDADKTLIAAKSIIKSVRSLDDSFVNKRLLSILSYRIFQNAFCADIRAGKLHKRTTSMDGYPALSININDTDYTCNEDILVKIFGENDKSIISPYEDDYTAI